MKIFENKSLFKKIIMIMLFIIVVSFSCVGEVKAVDGEVFGGKLLNPIADLLVFMGDGILNILHGVIYQYYDTTIVIPLIATALEIFLTGLLAVFITVAVAIAIVVSAGALAGALAAIGLSVGTVGIGTVVLVSVTAGVAGAAYFNSNFLPDNIHLPVYQLSPEKIFSNEIPVFDVDFFNPKASVPLTDNQGNIVYADNGNMVMVESTADKLRNTISNWYNILRDISIVALLSILVYVGIRIVISSTAGDKAKYKQMIMDWVVAICLLFFMQYIMAFSNLIVGKVTSFVTGLKYDSGYVGLIEDKDGKIEAKLNELNYDISKLKSDIPDVINWNTNILGLARLNAQMGKGHFPTYAGYTLVFVVLVFYTCYFVFTYFRRVLYMAFLTIIAPFVAMTYPIDKINDGKAQAFNMWIKEYIFNLLIQPMHLILYSILISSAFELASENIIYTLVAIGFMIPAEKLLRKFFGFEKAQTPGFLGGAAGAGLTMAAMNKLLSKGGSGGKGGGNDKSSLKADSENRKPPRINESFNKQDAMLGSGKGNSENVRNNDNNSQDNGQNQLSDNQNQDSNDELDENGQAWMDYINSQENEDVLGENESDENGQAWMDYINSQEDDTQRIDNFYQDTNSSEGNDISESSFIGKFKSNFKNNMGSYGMASRYYAKGLKDKAAKKIKNAKPAKAAARIIGGVATGALAGGIGLAAGIASGDPSKALQYGGGAALGGYKFGAGKVSRMQDALNVDGIDEIQERGKYETESEYLDAKQKDYIKEFQKNTNNQFKLEKHYPRKEAKRIMKEDVPDYIDKGIYNIDDMITINKMVKDNKVENRDMGIATAKYASMVGSDPKKMSTKKRNEWEDTLAEGWAKNSKIKKLNKDPREQAKLDLQKIHDFYDIKSKL